MLIVDNVVRYSLGSTSMADLISRTAHITAFAENVRDNADSAYRWLHEPQRGLGGAVPIELWQPRKDMTRLKISSDALSMGCTCSALLEL